MADEATETTDKQWQLGPDHGNLCILIDWLVESGCTPDELSTAVEKPWKYNDELAEALADLQGDDEDTAEDFSPEAGHHDPEEGSD